MVRTDLTQPALATFSGYTKYVKPCLWWYVDGTGLISATGLVYNVTQVSGTDLNYRGSHSTAMANKTLNWADQSAGAARQSHTGLIAALTAWVYQSYPIYDTVPAMLNQQVYLIDDADFSLVGTYYLPTASSAGKSYFSYGKYAFWNAAGSELYVLSHTYGLEPAEAWVLAVF
ncbi:MAG: hypothetical protein A2087_04010 [Spirochaetes bacterium GWD1_61_31]|nr:MAG: hypothetical protein A2Y37_12615 [Spirochaetes bacterium GWB1_60_80]OHD43223.1 MAG: hypothetical protein A2Y35_08330 [Spirochaetes bacterium GWE1_60_18]OHD44194.1 MAG: hypothetical protein A2087_04010 [Spirochaetes bacterium GWD1_61_31]HAP42703.1 hypothetical protein [Spirochaetaceae bacterium]HAW86067.1 hypothetical protein [Spirochaetaceae bacterium]